MKAEDYAALQSRSFLASFDCVASGSIAKENNATFIIFTLDGKVNTYTHYFYTCTCIS